MLQNTIPNFQITNKLQTTVSRLEKLSKYSIFSAFVICILIIGVYLFFGICDLLFYKKIFNINNSLYN